MSCRRDQKLQAYIEASHAPNTLKAYQADIKHFRAGGGRIPASPYSVASYLAEHAQTLSYGSLARRVAAINYAHSVRNMISPTHAAIVRATLRGIRRTEYRPIKEAAPLRKEDVVRLLGQASGARGIRDRALLLIGFSAALRRSELVALDVQHLDFSHQGVWIRIPKSKTDQGAKGVQLAIPATKGRDCPCKALKAWLEVSGLTAGPLFVRVSRYGHIGTTRLSGQSVALIIKNRAREAGLNPEGLSGHSLRSGFATAAVEAGVDSFRIRKQTRHRSDAMLARYVRYQEAFSNSPVTEIWR